MYSCPVCSEKTIGFPRKWLSSSSNPAMCSRCGAGSAIRVADAAGYLAGSFVLLTPTGFAVVWLHSFLVAVLGLVVTVCWYLWRQHKATLVVVAESEQRTAKRSAWLAVLACLVPSLFS